MAIADSIGDFLTGIRNAFRANKESVTLPSSKLKESLSAILKKEGYIKDFSVVDQDIQKFIHIRLRYLKGNRSAIKNLRRVSKPGLRVYVPAEDIPRVLNGMGTMVVSTSRGLMTDADARKENIGGELVCKVW